MTLKVTVKALKKTPILEQTTDRNEQHKAESDAESSAAALKGALIATQLGTLSVALKENLVARNVLKIALKATSNVTFRSIILIIAFVSMIFSLPDRGRSLRSVWSLPK